MLSALPVILEAEESEGSDDDYYYPALLSWPATAAANVAHGWLVTGRTAPADAVDGCRPCKQTPQRGYILISGATCRIRHYTTLIRIANEFRLCGGCEYKRICLPYTERIPGGRIYSLVHAAYQTQTANISTLPALARHAPNIVAVSRVVYVTPWRLLSRARFPSVRRTSRALDTWARIIR